MYARRQSVHSKDIVSAFGKFLSDLRIALTEGDEKYI